MSDVKLNGISQSPVKLAAVSSPQKAQESGSAKSELAKSELAKELGGLSTVEKTTEVAGKQEVEQAVTKLNDYVQTVQRNLQFNLDDESGKTIITVVDKNTSEVIRQIPDNVALKLAQNLQQSEPLSLFNAKV
jgi:flagellar protein FlaG